MKLTTLALTCCLSLLFTAQSCRKPQVNQQAVTNEKTTSGPQKNRVARIAAVSLHPGAFHTQGELALVRNMIASNTEPWISAWNAIKNSSPNEFYTSTASGVISDAYKLQNEGHAAYLLAIKWVATGDIKWANACKGVIDQWANNVTSMTTDPLRTGLGSAQMANAAEIIAYAFGGSALWPAANVANAKTFFKNVVYPRTVNGASANWGTSAMIGNMSMAVFCGDQAMFDQAVFTYKNGFSPLSDGCCGVTQYIDATGENAESGRDQGHSQGGIAHLMEVALIAWNQGVNLVTYNDSYGVRDYGASGANRILIGFEYTAKYNLGNTVPYHPFFEYCNDVTIYPNGVSAIGRGSFSPIWEMANKLFNSSGIVHPYTTQVTNTAGYKPEGSNSDHAGLGTLMFSPAPATQPIANGTYRLLSLANGKMLDNLGSTVNGASVGQWQPGTSNNQKWELSYGGGYYKIKCVTGGMFLDSGGGTANGAPVKQYVSSTSTNQQWSITAASGYYKIVNRATGKCLDTGGGTSNGAIAQIWQSGTSTNQLWSFGN